jgi:hypothetical protein
VLGGSPSRQDESPATPSRRSRFTTVDMRWACDVLRPV